MPLKHCRKIHPEIRKALALILIISVIIIGGPHGGGYFPGLLCHSLGNRLIFTSFQVCPFNVIASITE